MKKVLGMLVLIALLSLQAQAIYVDAEGGAGGNTVQASDGDADAWWIAATAPEGKWGRRTGFANNPGFTLGAPDNDIFEASGTGSGVEDCMAIMTTVTGLNPGELYKVSVIYWSQGTNQNWNVRAGFALDSLVLFDRDGTSGVAGMLTGKTEGDRVELSALIGQIQADSLGQIKVYLDDKPGTGYVDRTWYDGLVVEVPEPATMMLLGLGGLALLRKKR